MQLIRKYEVNPKPFHHGAVRTVTMCLWQHESGALYRTKHEREEHPTLTGIDWHVGALYQPDANGALGAPLFTKHVRMASDTDMHKALLAEISE